jgi:hypothetical protein
MASVMAQEQDWLKDGIELKFHGMDDAHFRASRQYSFDVAINTVKNDINGLIASVNDGSTSAFMWEWFTTKPYTEKGGPDDTGTVRFVRCITSLFCRRAVNLYCRILCRLVQC